MFLYLVKRRVPVDFRQFLIRHAELFRLLRYWTVRLLLPRRFKKAAALYKAALREERFSEGLAVSLLSAAQQPITQYSLVFNLTEGRVSVFRDRRFEDRIELQVQSKIAGAPRASTIRSLFLGAGR